MKEWRALRLEEFRTMLNATLTAQDERSCSAIHNELRLLEERLERTVQYVPSYYWNGRMVYTRINPKH